MPIHSLHWEAFASGLDDEAVIIAAMKWLCGNGDHIVVERTKSFHGSLIHIISAEITQRGNARRALSNIGEKILREIISGLNDRLDDENCVHFRLRLADLACARIVLAKPGEYRAVKGKVKLRVYPGNKPTEVAEILFSEAIDRANRMGFPQAVS